MTIVYFDTETGGTRDEHPTISLAAVAMDDDTEVSSFHQRIAFTVADCDPEALRLNRYTPEAWADAVPPSVCAAKFAAWLEPYRVVARVSKQGKTYQVARLAGYNAATFDAPRLRRLFGEAFCPWEYLVRDVLQLVLWHFDRVGGAAPENYKLATVAAHFGIPTDGAHDALADARMCATVARAIREAW